MPAAVRIPLAKAPNPGRDKECVLPFASLLREQELRALEIIGHANVDESTVELQSRYRAARHCWRQHIGFEGECSRRQVGQGLRTQVVASCIDPASTNTTLLAEADNMAVVQPRRAIASDVHHRRQSHAKHSAQRLRVPL